MACHTVEGRRLVAILGALVAAPIVLVGAQPALRFDFILFDVPQSVNTEAWGINPAGEVVGVYQDAQAKVHGFLRRDDALVSIDYPAAPDGPAVIRTQAEGINPQGDIVGAYKLAGEAAMAWHSFLLTRDGEFRNIDVPGWTGTVATSILPDGTILGCVHTTNMNTTMRGFVRTADGEISVSPELHNDLGGRVGTMNYGATPDHRMIVGRAIDVTNAPAQHWGFVFDDTGISLFRVPGSSFTQALGVSPRGEVIGYDFKEGSYKGFVKDGDDYTDIAYPGATDTFVWAINASGDVAGGASDGTQEHGLVGRRRR